MVRGLGFSNKGIIFYISLSYYNFNLRSSVICYHFSGNMCTYFGISINFFVCIPAPELF